MERQLSVMGLESWIQRFAAIDGLLQQPDWEYEKAAMFGCFKSHRDLITQSDPNGNLLILEDDVDLSHDFSKILTHENITNFANAHPDIDIIFLDCLAYLNAMPEIQKIAQRYMPHGLAASNTPASEKRQVPTVSILDAKNRYSVAAAAYIVTPQGKRTLNAEFSKLPDLYGFAIDHFYADLIRNEQLQARIFLPYLATPSINLAKDSTISESALIWSDPPEIVAAQVALRRLLFAGECHLDELRIMVAPLLHQFGPTPERKLALEILDAVENWISSRESTTNSTNNNAQDPI